MASITLELEELAKLINFYLNHNKVKEIVNLHIEEEKIQFEYDPAKFIPNIKLSIRIDSFKKKYLVLQLSQHTSIPMGDRLLKALNSLIGKVINNMLFGKFEGNNFKLCLMKDNFIYILIDSLEDKFFGDFPFKISDIFVYNKILNLKMSI